MNKKISDIIANFLKFHKIEYAFGIIGSANSYVFDSINKLGYTKIIYVHHEQSAVMAMGAYFRASGKLSVALVTAGGGSSNAITGVVSNWSDSIPGLIISGQEQYKYMKNHKNLRMYGIQGYDSPEMVRKVTKYAHTLTPEDNIQDELEKCLNICISGRPGPVWLDIPFDIQGKNVEERDHKQLTYKDDVDSNINSYAEYIKNKLYSSNRPIIIAGHGVRISDAKEEFKKLVNHLNIPIILTWSGIDLLPDSHRLNYGRSGIMGERSSNFIVQNSDLVIILGSRLSLLQTGHDLNDFASHAHVIINDIDSDESNKHNRNNTYPINVDTKLLINALLDSNIPTFNNQEWIGYCDNMKHKYPKLMPEHIDDNYINSYKFIDKLSDELKGNETIVTDMGTGLLSGHYSIKLKEGNIMFTSLGLGEMGYGLPGAIGASFTDLSRPIICLHCDGGMMMNLQELQTIKHHNLPIKLIIFNNDGYLMIKHTQKMLFNGAYNGVNANTGLSLPDFKKISEAFNFPYYSIKTWKDYDKNIKKFLYGNDIAVCEVFMNPEQEFIPKVKGIKKIDGNIFAPPIEEMSPLLPLSEVKENMIVGLSEKSKLIKR